MNTVYRLLFAGLMCFATLAGAAQGRQPDAVAGATQATPHQGQPHQGCMTHGMAKPVEFQSTKICFAPHWGAFVAIDSVECSVHLVKQVDGGRLDTAACFTTDNTRKRHDLKNILRPVSVSVMGQYVVVLASAVNDTAYIALLDQNMNLVARRGFNSPMYAMHFEHGNMFVVGRNPLGYDINVLSLRDGLEGFEQGEALTHHYRVFKQSEKIKMSDPVGIGLTFVAVAVVFLALICIALILLGSGRLFRDMEDKEKADKKASKVKPVSEGSSTASNELYAAIAAAIHLYNDELHDEEDTVITIQKVEREWTPWNAKYYNMNHYFNNKK
ncbi:MAG: OadG family protein [Bacteroidales bacterium]|nr:OadG family protein [Bacteroidales bacterium]